uniref:Uncharacterized protein n=1 Tax=Arundo donax TaxID=35708 RepID=A0A0A8Y1I9_ARUDO
MPISEAAATPAMHASVSTCSTSRACSIFPVPALNPSSTSIINSSANVKS